MNIVKYRERIYTLRGKKVMLDFDLSEFYGVDTHALNMAIERGKEYVKDGWLFQLTDEEWKELRQKLPNFPETFKYRPSPPWAYTREAANFVGTRLKTPTAVERTVLIIEVFSAIEHWFRVVAFSRLAEICSDYLACGSKLAVRGQLTSRCWEDSEGNKHSIVEIRARELGLLGKSNGNGNGNAFTEDGDS